MTLREPGAGRFSSLAETMNRRVVRRALLAAAKKYDEIVEDLERGHIRTRHAELMP
jgi:hypothetical protein